ncbi:MULTISPECIES: c-type cytochrome biogenesis protein CcmI [Oceanimonas]|uniref:C-type cytochrome biogenesis protein CcmI n=1 Tax=Oceanimonas doudoroffii TaxID=84158 RepID=A0A233RIK2_9GAMM|nr:MULTISPECIES: c-type cytochrome biogenesis protein CcmI [Oceanimonas]NHI00186.1 Cytochrome c-type biogenesis protein CcmH [Oceanimonas sp. MB9]OXY83221.1 c-type cytochrome biogenesis protein CcmI [Oceanimonas doudoroffii]
MTVFWILSAALTVLLALVIILPLMRGRAESSESRNELNTRLYRQRLQELKQESEQGLLEDDAALQQELQKSLLDDVVGDEPAARRGRSPLVLISALVLVVLVSYGVYWQLGAHRQVAEWQRVSAELPALSRHVLIQPDETVTDQDVRELMLALRTRLHQDGDDYRGWLLLGRLALELRDGETARDALDKALKLTDEPDAVRVPYAEALAMTGETLRAEQLVRGVLTRQPGNLEAWSVFAFMALQQNDFGQAIARWQQMLEIMPADHPRYAMVQRSIAFAEQQAGSEQSPVTGPRYQVEVNTASSVPYHPGAVLFVFAVDAAGGEMPLVARRIERPSFPMTITLSNADAMVPDNNLSSREAVVIKARIAPSGNVTDATDAWEGRSGVLDTDEDSQLSVLIDTPL